jgi:low affinity Fe/Cu permease
MSLNEQFRRSSVWAANILGSPWMFLANVLLILIWLVSGPIFRFSDTWQLIVNTATTVFTYLAVFLIQNTQNRDAKEVHLKLDELIRSIAGARNHLVDLEDLADEELEQLHKQFQRLQKHARLDGLKATETVKGESNRRARGDQ